MKPVVVKAVEAYMVSINLFDQDEGDIMPVWRFYSMHSTGSLWPERVEIRWENGKLMRLAVYGLRMRKDGEVGNGASSTQFVQHGEVLEQNNIPEWLQELVMVHSPERAR